MDKNPLPVAEAIVFSKIKEALENCGDNDPCRPAMSREFMRLGLDYVKKLGDHNEAVLSELEKKRGSIHGDLD